jgi:hypothetical protein
MKTARVTYGDGNVITTNINGTDAEILKYFAPGKMFNIGNVEDNMQPVIQCEILRKFKFRFVGREKGAIGIFYEIHKDVEAFNLEDARLKLYDTHEHVQQLVQIN